MRLSHVVILSTVLAGPALAQTSNPALPPGVSETQEGTPLRIPSAPGLPGVGLDPAADSAADSEAGEPRGAGGMQNGVGGDGTLAPSTTGSNDDILDEDQADDSGLPIGQ